MNKTKTVKNISGVDLVVIGVGEVDADATIVVDADFENPNFEEVKVRVVDNKNKIKEEQ